MVCACASVTALTRSLRSEPSATIASARARPNTTHRSHRPYNHSAAAASFASCRAALVPVYGHPCPSSGRDAGKSMDVVSLHVPLLRPHAVLTKKRRGGVSNWY